MASMERCAPVAACAQNIRHLPWNLLSTSGYFKTESPINLPIIGMCQGKTTLIDCRDESGRKCRRSVRGARRQAHIRALTGVDEGDRRGGGARVERDSSDVILPTFDHLDEAFDDP